MTSKGFLNHMEYFNYPSGSLLMGVENYHHPFRKTETNYFNKHHKSLYHKEGEIPPEFERTFHQHHRSITNDMNNLQNFNPTIGTTYYEEHDTNKMLHGGVGSRPRYELFNFKDTSVIDKIDNWKKDGNHIHIRPEHSQRLMVRRI